MKKTFNFLSTVWLGLSTHRLRSFLTMLGVIIGVASVITLMAIGKGTTADILASIESLGSNLITVSPGAFSFRGVGGAGGSTRTLTQEDGVAISEQVNYIAALAPTYSTNLQVVFGGENMNYRVTGTTPEYQQVYNLAIANGTFFTVNDYYNNAKLAVLGSNVVEELFGDINPVGQKMRMGSIIVHIVGVIESKGGGFNSPDDSIYIPLTALQQTVAQQRTSTGDRVVSSLALIVTDKDKSSYVVEEITSLLRTRHRLGTGVDDDFRITSMDEIAGMVSETSNQVTTLLGAIAAISLLVAGIGVMNIMLVSVLERTREIGIRKALGARERDIWGQFLLEAILLTFAGGIIGVFVGWGTSLLVPGFFEMSTVITADIIIIAVSVAVGIGLFFGFYPAWNASRLNPIDALRSE